MVSKKGIKIDPDKVQAIQDLPPPRTQKEDRSFMGRLNYIAHFISQMTAKYDEECQTTFDKVKEYLTNAPVLVPFVPKRPLILYLIVHEMSMGCILGQHDETRHKEQAIYYLSKKFTSYESKYSSLEKMCCALAWEAQRLK